MSIKIVESRGISIPVVEDEKAYNWIWDPEATEEEKMKRMRWLLELFPENEEVPLITGDTPHPYFTVWRGRVPLEITDASHPMHTKCISPEIRPFDGPELVFKMSLSYHIQVCWSKRNNTLEQAKMSVHVMKRPSEWVCYARFVPLMSMNRGGVKTTERFLIYGSELCRKQLEVWGVDLERKDIQKLL